MKSRRITSIIAAVALSISLFSGSVKGVKADTNYKISPSSSTGLRVQLYASNWGLSGKWTNTDILGTSRTRDGEFDLSRAARALGQNREELKRIRIDGFLIPEFSEIYRINTNHDQDLKVWIDDQLVVNYGIVSEIELQASKEHKIELELQNKGYNDIELMWESQSQSLEVIPSDALRAPIEVSDVGENSLVDVDYNPKNDTDGDGIPDSWERNGYSVQEGIVMPYDESVHKVKYVTDDRRRSTDGDPYSDFEEVTGIGLDQSVKWPGNDPLIPAYPILEFVPTSIKIVPSLQNENVKSVKIGSGSTEKVSKIDSNGESDGGFEKGIFKSKAEIGIKYERDGAAASGFVGAYYKMDASGGMDWNSRSSSTDETKDIEEESEKLSRNEASSEAVTVDFTKYAYLKVNGYYRNSGTATAYSVEPTMNLSIADKELEEEVGGNTVVKTFGVIEEQRPKLIGPQLSYPTNGSVSLSLTTSTSSRTPEHIRLTKEQADKLDMGYPFRIGAFFNSYKEFGTKADEKRWSSYEHAIDEVSAKVVLTLPKASPVERKIYAASEDNPMDLVQAVERLFSGRINEDGNLVVDGEEISTSNAGQWGVKVVVKDQDDFDSLQSQIGGGDFQYSDLILKPGMEVQIYKKDSAAQASILAAYYNPIDSKIYASVVPGAEAVKSVKAKIKTDTEKTITLQQDPEDNTKFSSEPVPTIKATFRNILVAESENGDTVERKIFVDNEYQKIKGMQGLNYLQFPEELSKKPYTSEATRDAVKDYVQSHDEHKYYMITIGENIRKPFEKRQISQYLDIGENRIYNASEVQMKRATSYSGTFASQAGDYRLRVLIKPSYGPQYNYWSENHIRNIRPGTMYLWPGTGTHKVNGNFKFYDVKHYSTRDNTIALRLKTRISDQNWKNYGEVIHFVNGSYSIRTLSGKYYFTKAARNQKEVFGLMRDADFYDVTPAAEHTQSAIVSRNSLLNYLEKNHGFWNTNTLVIEGMFTQGEDGKVFIPKMGGYTSITGGTGEISNSFDQRADSVMINFRKNGEDHGAATFGKTNVAVNTGNSNGVHQDMAIVDLKDNDTINKKIDNGKRLDVQVLGYFVDKSDLKDGQRYWQYWIPSEKIRTTLYPQLGEYNPSQEDGPTMEEALGQLSVEQGVNRFMVPWKSMDVNGYSVDPKGFILKVDQKGVGVKKFDLRVNGNSYRMDLGHKLHSNRNPGSRYNPMNHTGYIFVPANSNNKYALDFKLDVDTSEELGVQGQVNIQVVGFFYENLY